ncbi:phospholipid scramblase 1-like protein [Labeo rohita]|uniref:Phospholipid scramblase n=1 Tax=Labeo rohita TaxID=84645 RepID=A0A498NTW6_LABRO|nr:phospholipid scramblase 1-like protein [Labeo rohita]
MRSVKRYNVKDDTGKKVFSILEDSECCNRSLCPGAHSFIMKVTNVSNQEVIRLVHPRFHCCGRNELEIQSPPGTAIGYVRKNWHCLPKFTVMDEEGELAFKIEGPCLCCTCCEDDNFELLSLNEEATEGSSGKILKPSSTSGPNAGQAGGANVPSDSVPVAPVYTIGPHPGRNEVYPTPAAGYMPPQVPMFMPVPDSPPGCPQGLEYLTQVDQLLVHQKVELMEVLTGWETNNQYVVKNSLGQQVFFAAEESDFCTRMVCGSVRSFLLHIQDNMGREDFMYFEHTQKQE